MSINASGAGGSKTVLIGTTIGIGLIGIGVGSILGGGTVYYFFIKRKLQDIFNFQRSLRLEIDNLRGEVVNLRTQLQQNSSILVNRNRSSIKERDSRRSVKFAGGYETAEDEEFVTASSTSSEAEEEEQGGGDASILSRRVPNSPKLINGSLSPVPTSNVSLRNRKVPEEELIDAFYRELDQMFEGDDDKQDEAYSALETNQYKYAHSSEFWWRFAKATHLKATAYGNKGDRDSKKNFAFEAFSCAEKALALNYNCANVHKWYAITLGSKGEFISTNEKIQNGYKFKEHIDQAITISPTDSTLHYLLGRFCFEISQLSWIERQVASTLFSTPPSSSYEEALQHFETSENLGKPFKDNRLYIAKCYIGMGDFKNAANWLLLASSLSVLTPTDNAAQNEINALVQKYGRYAS